MIDQIDERLKTWVTSVVGAVNVAFTSPGEMQADPVVHLYLMKIVPVLATQDASHPPKQVKLHYLVAVRAADPEATHKLLGELIFAALDSTDFEIDYDPITPETWLALGTELQPGFVIQVPFTRERPVPDTQLVRVPMVTHATSITSLQGVVIGPKDLPLAGVLVELPTLRQYQRTDSRGRFRFPTVPAAPATKLLRVSGKGHELEVNVEQGAEPVIIRLFEESSP
ncbi:MAG: hypothetical protein GC204_07840 [Chloroflexi bacterium]|nr:hypothetical protein [Chloroflexota bacterium]